MESFPSALNELLESKASLLLRMRLQCAAADENGNAIALNNGDRTGEFSFSLIKWSTDILLAFHAMNEVTLHRGASPHLTIIDTHVDNQHFTESVVSIFSP